MKSTKQIDYHNLSISSSYEEDSEYEFEEISVQSEEIEFENDLKAKIIEKENPFSPLMSKNDLSNLVNIDYRKSKADFFSPTPAFKIPLNGPFTPEFIHSNDWKERIRTRNLKQVNYDSDSDVMINSPEFSKNSTKQKSKIKGSKNDHNSTFNSKYRSKGSISFENKIN